jgi:hypothetical protein
VAGASDSEAREFAATVRRFLDWVHGADVGGERGNEVVALLADFLGPEGERAVGRGALAANV